MAQPLTLVLALVGGRGKESLVSLNKVCSRQTVGCFKTHQRKARERWVQGGVTNLGRRQKLQDFIIRLPLGRPRSQPHHLNFYPTLIFIFLREAYLPF